MAIESQAKTMKGILRVEGKVNTMDSEAFNLSRFK
jgi:hypothetical protein